MPSDRRYGRRWGRFRITGEFIEQATHEVSQGNLDNFGALMAFMPEVLIVRAADTVDGTTIEYFGVSPHFEELEEGDAIPEYMIKFERRRTCNGCNGTKWWAASNVSLVVVPGSDDDEIVCQGCGNYPENSRWVATFKACKRA